MVAAGDGETILIITIIIIHGVVERRLSQSQIFKGIWDKNTAVPKDVLMVFRDEMMDYKRDLKLVL